VVGLLFAVIRMMSALDGQTATCIHLLHNSYALSGTYLKLKECCFMLLGQILV